MSDVADPELKLKPGTVVHDAECEQWVFVGYRLTTTSHSLEFVKAGTVDMRGERWTYHATHRDTILRKFPDAAVTELD
jgi:hypothetical protein